MIVKKSPPNTAAKLSNDMNSGNTGSMVVHKDAEAEASEFDLYMKMLREFNKKYEGDRSEMELRLVEVCKNLSFNQRQANIEVFIKKRNTLKSDMEAEIAHITQKYNEKINDISKIIEHKQQLECLRGQFKDLGFNIEEMECMKDIGEKNKGFRKEGTFEIHDANTGDIEVRNFSNEENSVGLKKIYKLGDKPKQKHQIITQGVGTPTTQEPEAVPSLLSNISKLKKINSNDKISLTSRNILSKGAGSPSIQTPKGADKKTQLSTKNLIGKKPITSYITDKHKGSESSADKMLTGIKKK